MRMCVCVYVYVCVWCVTSGWAAAEYLATLYIYIYAYTYKYICIHSYKQLAKRLFVHTHDRAKGAWCRIGWTAHRKTDPSGFDAVTSYFEKSSARLDSAGLDSVSRR